MQFKLGLVVLILLLPTMFILGILAGNFVFRKTDSCEEKFTYINPDFSCGSKLVIDKSNLILLKEKITKFIESAKSSGQAEVISVYFRDLRGGPILGINENELFIPASLLKLPVALTFFKIAEEDMADIFQRRLRFEGNIKDDLEQTFKPKRTIQQGSSYTVEELIFNSLVYSDNTSNEALKAVLKSIDKDENLVLQTYKELGLIAPTNINELDISTRGYSSIFRMLYNASYLSPEHSEKVLSILALSDFDQGIVSGVPKDIKVANKLGERFTGEEKQLHDCGIVYFPDNPYLLCIMTRGTDWDELTKIIKAISEIVYQEVDSRRL